jgi:hypothetical protein
VSTPLIPGPAREVSEDLRNRLHAAVSDAYYDARNARRTTTQAAEDAVNALLPIIASVDANAHARGGTEAAERIESARDAHWQKHLTEHPYADATSCPGDYAAHDAYHHAAKIARGTP